MSRAARITVGAVVAGVLAFVAVVAGAMAGASSFQGHGLFEETWLFEGQPAYATAEVLDVDDDFGHATVDVRWTTDDGEVVVTWVDWEHDDQVPAVGDEVDVVYDSADPEWAFAADDPAAADVEVAGAGAGTDGAEPAAAGGSSLGQVSGWVALGALLLLVTTVVVTVVAAVRAPAPPRLAGGPEDPFAWQPGHLPPPRGIAPQQHHGPPQQHHPPQQYAPPPRGSGAAQGGVPPWHGPS